MTSRRAVAWGNYVNWWRVAICLVLIATGLAALVVIDSDSARWGWFGWLSGVGLGALLAEAFSVKDRRDAAEEHRQLLEEARSRGRAAYRIGEFFFAACSAIKQGDPSDRHVTEVLNCAEVLGIRQQVDGAFRAADPDEPDFYATIATSLSLAISFTGDGPHLFFSLGQDLMALRTPEAQSDTTARDIVVSRVSETLVRIRAWTAPIRPEIAWKQFVKVWHTGQLEDSVIAHLVGIFHGYLLTLGVDQLGGGPYEDAIVDLYALRSRNARTVTAVAIEKVSAA